MDKNKAYEILGLKPGASWEELKNARNHFAFIYHPDRYQGNEERAKFAEEKMKEVNSAYVLLKKYIRQEADREILLREEQQKAREDIVLLEKSDENPHIAILTWNRVDAGNALNTPMLLALAEKFDEIERDKSIRVVIMHSTGKNASFGADLNELVVESDGDYTNMSREDAVKHINDGRKVAEKMYKLRIPVIGLIHGFCLGGGAELYTNCDVLYAASGGKDESGLMYGFPEPTIGVMAGWMGPEMLIRRIGAGNAKDVLLSGRMVSADQALAMGIVQGIFPKDDLMSRAMKWAGKVAANAPYAVESTRRTLNSVLFPVFKEVLDATGSETVNNLMTADFVKGAKKILTKSKDRPDYERA